MSPQMINVARMPLPDVNLVTAAGDELLMVDHIQTSVLSIGCILVVVLV